jgi:hypothetical protein
MHSTPQKVISAAPAKPPTTAFSQEPRANHPQDIDCGLPQYLTCSCVFQLINEKWESKQRKASALLQSSLASQSTPL